MPEIKLIRTDCSNQEFIDLVDELNAELSERDGLEHTYYHQFNSIDDLKHVIVVYEDNQAISCGALKHFDKDVMEIKRMYTKPKYRAQGYASKVLKELENWASENNMKRVVLETGKRQPEAIALYEKYGYTKILNYGPYEKLENSVCFEKSLS